MTLRPNLLQSTLIGTCLLLAAGLLYPRQPAYPSPISSFGSAEVMRGEARVYENLDFEITDEENRAVAEKGDSIALERGEAQAVLKILLDGLHYLTPAYAAYTDQTYDNSLVLCHFPRFLLAFYDTKGKQSHYFSICFECSNVRVSIGTKYPKFREYMMTAEGELAFKKLQEEYFPGRE